MATNKRMFNNEIVGSDAFLEMPVSTQALYFHLNMKADDDGFVNPKMIIRMVGCGEDDLKILIGKKFVIPFENGVIVVKHWNINNNKIQKDRYKPTLYQDQKKLLFIKPNGGYTLDKTKGNPACHQNVNKLLTQNRIEENRIEKNNTKNKLTLEEAKATKLPQEIPVQTWNDWIDYRYKIKKPFATPKSLELHIQGILEHKPNCQQVIEQSLANGWTGIFPLKSKNGTPNYSQIPQNSLKTNHSATLLDKLDKGIKL